MSGYTISIPDKLYRKAKRLADALDQRSIDLPADELAELRALAYLSDDTLWTIAREQMQVAKQEQMSVLMDKNSLGTISDSERVELETLVESGQCLILRKAEAMKLLMDRGYSVTLEDLDSTDE